MTRAALLALTLLSASVAGAQPGPMATTEHLRVPRQNALLFKTLATGSQIYVCAAKSGDPDAFAWSFRAPVADLWDERGERVGRHYAGPTWEADDGSTIVGAPAARADAPEPGSIPWLLLRAKSNHGDGAFARVTYVQRLETVGGVAPSDGCDEATAYDERAVEYRATYAYYGFDPRHVGDAE